MTKTSDLSPVLAGSSPGTEYDLQVVKLKGMSGVVVTQADLLRNGQILESRRHDAKAPEAGDVDDGGGGAATGGTYIDSLSVDELLRIRFRCDDPDDRWALRFCLAARKGNNLFIQVRCTPVQEA